MSLSDYAKYYPANWPTTNPFHQGEVKLQKLANVHQSVMSYAPRVVRPYMPPQHLEFYRQQPFLVAAALDSKGRMWSTLLTSPTGSIGDDNKDESLVMSVTAKKMKKSNSHEHHDYHDHNSYRDDNDDDNDDDLTKLLLKGGPVPGDALHGELQIGSDLGLLGIEFATKRRNRVNGRIVSLRTTNTTVTNNTDGSTTNKSPTTITEQSTAIPPATTEMVFQVDQAFGNCPQYIKPRQWWSVRQEQVHTPTTPVFNNNNNNNKILIPTGSTVPNQAVCRPFTLPEEQTSLTPQQIQTISRAETIFVATGYRGKGHDVRYGNDASHRGGPPGFVIVQDECTIILPDFSGNNHFNSLGNLEMDPRMGITFPDFEGGGLLQLSGWAQVDMDTKRAAKVYPGALRVITFHIQYVHVVPPGSLPIRWSSSDADQERPMVIAAIVQESNTVKSFYLRPLPQDKRPLWSFQAGQHLPIRLVMPPTPTIGTTSNTDTGTTSKGGEIWRTYSLSGPPSAVPEYYRISVKREQLGLASRLLHDNMQEGDVVEVNAPAGDFVLKSSTRTMPSRTLGNHNKNNNIDDDDGKRKTTSDLSSLDLPPSPTLVLLSAGIGITPLLSMLHHVVETPTRTGATADYDETNPHPRPRRVVWIHGARDGDHHPFRDEVRAIQHEARHCHSNVSLETHIRFSQGISFQNNHNEGDQQEDHIGLEDSYQGGRVDIATVRSIVSNPEEIRSAEYYLCGPGGFTSDMEGSLELLGVSSNHIHFETF